MTRPPVILISLALAWACAEARYAGTEQGPALTMPARFAEGDAGKRQAQGAAGGTHQEGSAQQRTLQQRSEPQREAAALPDPEPLIGRDVVAFTLRYRQGNLSLVAAERLELEQPRPTARRMGRWVVELWLGAELIERVRFDFPLLAAEPPPREGPTPIEQPPGLAAGADSQYRVLVPASPRATKAILVDRATGEQIPLPWPVGQDTVRAKAGE